MTVPNTFTSGTSAVASEVNENCTYLDDYSISNLQLAAIPRVYSDGFTNSINMPSGSYYPSFSYDPLENPYFYSTTGSFSTAQGMGAVFSASGTFTLNGFNAGGITVTKGVVVPNYSVMELYDTYPGTLDTTIWTDASTGTGTVTDTGSYLNIQATGGSGNGIAVTQGSTNVNLINYSTFCFKLRYDIGSTPNDDAIRLYVTDGTNEVQFFGVVDSAADDDWYLFVRKFDNEQMLEVIYYNEDDEDLARTYYRKYVDISSLNGSTFRFKFMAQRNSDSTCRLWLYNFYYEKLSPTTTVQASLSGDNSTFTNTDTGVWSDITSGTDPTTKLTITLGANEYLCLYNMYTEFR